MSRTKIKTVHIDQGNFLKKLTIQDLVVFHEACERALSGAQGIMNQPRTSEPAHSLIEELLTEHCGLLMGATIKELQARTPANKDDLELRNSCLATWHLHGGEYSAAVKTLLDIGMRPSVKFTQGKAELNEHRH
jgi:hypothetical protein